MDMGDIQRGDGNKQREMDGRKRGGMEIRLGCTQILGLEINKG